MTEIISILNHKSQSSNGILVKNHRKKKQRSFRNAQKNERNEMKTLNFEQFWEEKIESKVNDFESYVKNNNVSSYREKNSVFICLPTNMFCREDLSSMNWQGILEIKLNYLEVCASLQIIDENGNYIRARSQHQKTAVCRYINTLNSKNYKIVPKCHPFSGELKFQINYITELSHEENGFEMKEFFDSVIEILSKNTELITKILEFLEYVPIEKNKFLESLSETLEKCRTVILGSHKEYKESKNYEVYEECMLEPLPQKEIKYSWQDGTIVRILLEDLISKIKGKLLLNCLSSKKTNWAFVTIKGDKNKIALAKLEEIKGIIANGGSLQSSEFEQFTDGYHMNCNNAINQANSQMNSQVSNGKNERKKEKKNPNKNEKNNMLYLDFMYKGSRRCEEETKKIEKISKLHYYKFLREYVCIKDFELLNKNYLIRKHEEFIKLHTYLLTNKLTLSFLTRLQLCYELVSIGYIAMTNMKRFVPSYESYDINLCQNYEIKIETVASNYRNSVVSVQIAETCYETLYNLRCSSHGLKEIDEETKIMKWYHAVKTIDDGEAKYQGISVMTYWLKKILTDVINNESYREKNINIHRKTYLKSSKPTTLMSLVRIPSNSVLSDTFDFEKEEAENIDKNEGRQKEELEKMLFVISLTYKCYKEIFEEKENIFDIEI